MRPDWDIYFIVIAKMASMRSTCVSRPTGAIIVRDNHILTTGYNGSMPGVPHCSDTGKCLRRHLQISDAEKYNYCRSIHAETNAIAQAAKFGIPVKGVSIYCTLAPCYICLKLLASAGIKRVYYETAYKSIDNQRDGYWAKAMDDAGIWTEQVTIPPNFRDFCIRQIKQSTSDRKLKSE
jgi:dCMP deaminase